MKKKMDRYIKMNSIETSPPVSSPKAEEAEAESKSKKKKNRAKAKQGLTDQETMLVSFLEGMRIEEEQRYPCRVDEEQKQAWRDMAERLRSQEEEPEEVEAKPETEVRKKKKKRRGH